MERLIDKMLSTEFERYATADLNRPLDEDQQILEGVGSFFKHITVFCSVTT
jgi:vacuolar protein sorting-associated protein 54